jgi:hypothetical protein
MDIDATVEEKTLSDQPRRPVGRYLGTYMQFFLDNNDGDVGRYGTYLAH